ncbi:hypothetical protein A9Q91_05570 [Candidatus Gracilibacteria bacterium 28_42_T64]|nr:hypothetical protein A9Q91_05570 [Candidatus Gracilibacteria bacterium 28_42_T64]
MSIILYLKLFLKISVKEKEYFAKKYINGLFMIFHYFINLEKHYNHIIKGAVIMFVYGGDTIISDFTYLQKKRIDVEQKIVSLKERNLCLNLEAKNKGKDLVYYRKLLKIKKRTESHKNMVPIYKENITNLDTRVKKIRREISATKALLKSLNTERAYFISFLNEYAISSSYSAYYDFYASYSDLLGISDITSCKPIYK